MEYLLNISSTVCFWGDVFCGLLVREKYATLWSSIRTLHDLYTTWQSCIFSVLLAQECGQPLWRELSIFFLDGWNWFLHPASHSRFWGEEEAQLALGYSTFCVPALLCHAPSAPAVSFLSPSLTAKECLSIPFLFLPVARELFTSSLDTHCSPQGQVCSNLPLFGSEYISFIFLVHCGYHTQQVGLWPPAHWTHGVCVFTRHVFLVPPTLLLPQVSLKIKVFIRNTELQSENRKGALPSWVLWTWGLGAGQAQGIY